MSSNGNGHEKSPLRSKKFLAFLLSEITWKLLAGAVLAWAWNTDAIEFHAFIVLLVIVILAAFVEVGFILGQAGLDRFVRLATIAAKVGMETKKVPIGAAPKREAEKAPKDDDREGEGSGE